MFIFGFGTFIVLLLVQKSHLSSDFRETRKNYCSRIVSYTENIVVPETKIVNETYRTPCWSFTLSCTRHRFKNVTVDKVIPTQLTKRVFDCCPGYVKKKDACIPFCISCGHGKCIGPNSCLCEPGWREPFCQTECEPNRFGRGCKGNCTCFHGAECDQRTGFCHCLPGYTGKRCELPCPENTYGQDCKNKCECMNDGICDIKTGTCDCTPGFEGEYCEKPCENGTHGQDCEYNCICIRENTELCHHVDGKCKCKPGYTGKYCEKECDGFTYGYNCSKLCNCVNAELCDPTNGKCYCKPGWTGETCSDACPSGTFGENCNLECRKCSKTSSYCDSVTGDCICLPGFYGYLCDAPCLPGFWGSNCSNKCHCSDNGICDRYSGKCIWKTSIISGNDKREIGMEFSMAILIGILVTAVVITVWSIWLWIYKRKKSQSLSHVPFGRKLRKGKKAESSDLPGVINNPVYEHTDVVLESEQNGRDCIRGSFSSGMRYFKNNMNKLDEEGMSSNIKDVNKMPVETEKVQNDIKDSGNRKSNVLNDISAALKDLKRSSVRKTNSTHSSTAALDEDFQPEILDDFNTIENIYDEIVKGKDIEAIYSKLVRTEDETLSEKEKLEENRSGIEITIEREVKLEVELQSK